MEATAEKKSESSPLLQLPPELHLEILDHLNFAQRVFFSQTNRYFQSIIKEIPTDKRQKALLVFEKETWPRYMEANMFACSRCLKLKDFHEFSDKQRTHKRRKGGSQCLRRFCLMCGFTKDIYCRDSFVTVLGSCQVACRLCCIIGCGCGWSKICYECLKRDPPEKDWCLCCKLGDYRSHYCKTCELQHKEPLGALRRRAWAVLCPLRDSVNDPWAKNKWQQCA